MTAGTATLERPAVPRHRLGLRDRFGGLVEVGFRLHAGLVQQDAFADLGVVSVHGTAGELIIVLRRLFLLVSLLLAPLGPIRPTISEG